MKALFVLLLSVVGVMAQPTAGPYPTTSLPFSSVIDPSGTYLLPKFTNFHKRYVSPTGNDGTAVVDDAAHPWKFLETAISVANQGDSFMLTAGAHFCTNELVWPKNCAVFGAGRTLTTIQNWPNPLSAGSYMFRPSDNMFVQDLTIECGLWDKPASYYATDPIYNDSGFAVVSPYGSATGGFTNATLYNIEMHGRNDEVQLSEASPTSSTFYNLFLRGHWDHFFFSASQAHVVTIYGLTVNSSGPGIDSAFLTIFTGNTPSLYTVNVTGATIRLSDSNLSFGQLIRHTGDGQATYNLTNVTMITTCNNPISSISTNLHFFNTTINGTNQIPFPYITTIPISNTTNFTAYAAGTAYTLTGSSAALSFGTTSPVLTINQAGTYLIQGAVGIKYNGATYAGAQTITLKFRRTNNTAADLANGSRAVELPVLTTFTGGDVMAMPPVVYTATSGDTVTIFGIVSATPSAGSVLADTAELVATRLY